MIRNTTPGLALPLLVALGLSTAVFAQDATTESDTGIVATGTPLDWDESMNDAFFSDTTSGTLRTDAEITANWASLTPEQQDRVRQHCETVDADASGTDGTAPAAPVAGADGALSTAETGTTATGDANASSDAGATGTLTTEQASANMSQICGLITGL